MYISGAKFEKHWFNIYRSLYILYFTILFEKLKNDLWLKNCKKMSFQLPVCSL